jgi:hypothetical protein
MNRIGTFFLGFLVGGVVVYTSLHFHIVRATEGLHFVPKVTSTFSETYVDVRDFGLDDWSQHPALVAALTQAGKTSILQGAITQPIQQAAEGLIRPFAG